MSIAISVSGQPALPTLHKNVDLPAEDLRFDMLLHLITEQTGIKFSLNTQKFRPSRMMHVRKGRQSVDELLLTIRKSTGIAYTFVGDHIIFIDKPSVATIVKKRSAPAPAPDPVSAPAPASTVVLVFTPLSRAGIDNGYPSIVVRVDSLKTPAPVSEKPAPHRSRSPGRQSSRPRSPRETGFFAGVGLAADETFYIDPSLRAGWPFLYGMVQWSTNFNVSGVRYGIGGSLGLTNTWRLGLQATTGAYSKTYQQELGGPLPIPLTMRSTLQKIGILAEARIGRSLQLQFGPVLNLLSTKYYNTLGIPTPLFLSEADANSQYRYIKPPYTLEDTYSAISTGNTKIWIGLQAGLFYSINFHRTR
jgi:hypothetical protein